MKKELLRIGILIGVFGFMMSCDFDGLELIDTDSTVQSVDAAKDVIEENAEAELQVVKVFENVNNYGIIEEGKKSTILDGNPTYNLLGNILTIDYTEVVDASGKIIVTFNKVPVPFHQKGLIGEVTFDGYQSTGISVDGGFTLTVDEVDLTIIKFTLNSFDYMTFTDAENNSFQWMCEQTVLWGEGFSSPFIASDDIFIVNGFSNQMQNNETHKMEVEDLVLSSDCEYLVDGLITVTAFVGTDNEFIVTTDFGVDEDKIDNGECDAWILMNSEGIVDDLHIKISSL